MVNTARAPIFRDAFTLCEWVNEQLQREPTPVARAACGTSLRLLESVTLALQDRCREDRLEEADERLVALRLHLRLARALGLLERHQVIHALECADQIGRQIGGWRRSLGPA